MYLVLTYTNWDFLKKPRKKVNIIPILKGFLVKPKIKHHVKQNPCFCFALNV